MSLNWSCNKSLAQQLNFYTNVSQENSDGSVIDLQLPNQGVAGQVLSSNGDGTVSWGSGGGGGGISNPLTETLYPVNSNIDLGKIDAPFRKLYVQNQTIELVDLLDDNKSGALSIDNGNIYLSSKSNGGNVNLGFDAGLNTGDSCTSIGNYANQNSTGSNLVSIGFQAGRDENKSGSISIGNGAHLSMGGENSIAIGTLAGASLSFLGLGNNGDNTICIGQSSGQTNSHPNSIILNSTGDELNSYTQGLFIKPIRELPTGANILGYDGGTGEIFSTTQTIIPSDGITPFNYIFSTITTPIPATGELRFNNNIQNNATELYISRQTSLNIDIESFLETLSGTSLLIIQDKNNSQNYIKVSVLGSSHNVPYSVIEINVEASSGSGSTSFGIGTDLLVSLLSNDILVYNKFVSLENKTQNIVESKTDATRTYFNSTVESNSGFKITNGTNIQYLLADGTTITQSANSGNSNFYLYTSHGGISVPPPATGQIAYNNANQSLATEIYIDHITSDNIDIEIFFQNITTLTDVYIQDKNDSTNFIRYNVIAPPTILINQYVLIPVAVLTSGGSGSTTFGANHPALVSFFTNQVEIDLRLSNLETKTQLQSSNATDTNFSGSINKLYLRDNNEQTAILINKSENLLSQGIGTVSIGCDALLNTNSGGANTAVGFRSQKLAINGSKNTTLGAQSLENNISGIENTAIGFEALLNNTGDGCVAIGSRSSNVMTNLNNTISIGYNSQPNVSNQVVLGDGNITEIKTSGRLNTTGFLSTNTGTFIDPIRQDNTQTGLLAYNPTTKEVVKTNITVPSDARVVALETKTQNQSATSGSTIFTGSINKMFIADNNTASNVFINKVVNTSTGSFSTSIGAESLQNVSSNANTAYGFRSSKNTTTGAGNTSIGSEALSSNINGIQSVAVGSQALLNSTGDINVGIGALAGSTITTQTNCIAIGTNAQPSVSNQIQLGNTSITEVRTSGRLNSLGVVSTAGGIFIDPVRADNLTTNSVLTYNPLTKEVVNNNSLSLLQNSIDITNSTATDFYTYGNIHSGGGVLNNTTSVYTGITNVASIGSTPSTWGFSFDVISTLPLTVTYLKIPELLWTFADTPRTIYVWNINGNSQTGTTGNTQRTYTISKVGLVDGFYRVAVTGLVFLPSTSYCIIYQGVATEKLNTNVVTNIAPTYITNIYGRNGGLPSSFPSIIASLNVPYTMNFEFNVLRAVADIYGETLFTDNITMGTGQINLNSKTILNMSTPSLTTDGANKSYVDTQDALQLNLSGGIMSGQINLGAQRLLNMATCITGTDGANKSYVDGLNTNLLNFSSWREQTFGYIANANTNSVDSSNNWMNHLGGSLALQTIASGNTRSLKYRVQSLVSSVSNGAICGWLGAGTSPSIIVRQGFRVVMGFGLGDTTVNASTRTMIGLFQSNTAPVLNNTATVASIVVPSMGIIQESGENVWSFNTRGSSSSTKVPTLISCQTISNTWFILEMVNQVNSNDVTITLTDQESGSVATQTFTCGTTATLNITGANFLQQQRNMSSTGGTTGSAILQTASFRVWSST